MKIQVIGPNDFEQSFEIEKGTSCEALLTQCEKQFPFPIYACKVDNNYRGLPHKLMHDCTVEFLDLRNQEAWLVYQDSLAFLYIKAVHDIFGTEATVEINNSLNKGLYTVIKESGVTEDTVAQVENRMRELVEQNVPIVKEHMPKEEALELSRKLNRPEKNHLLQSLPSLRDVEIYSLLDESNLFYGLMVPSTGYLTMFELKRYRNGVLLRFPHPNNPSVIPPYEDQKLLYEAFSEATRWGKLMGINYVADLNERILQGDTLEMVLMQEALHEKRIAEIADMIKDQKKRVVLICGPSSSGKTTFAKRLCNQLKVNGLRPLYLGTDDYFVERTETPVDSEGNKDYECLEAVDVPLFNSNMNDLLAGKKVDLPEFDFMKGTKVFGKRITAIEEHQPIVIEGIHALNGKLTNQIAEEEKFKIYISPLTNISIDSQNRIPTTDARMLRRLVRDYQFRGKSAQVTIEDWPKVRRGEEINIFPYNGEADVFFNSYLIYELAVLKKYAEPLLREIKRDEPEYAEAQRMLAFLRFFEPIEDDSSIENTSILREFIGGSVIVQ